MKKYITIVEFLGYGVQQTATFVDDDIPMRYTRRRRLRAICSTAVEIGYITYEATTVASERYDKWTDPTIAIGERNRAMEDKARDIIAKMGESK